jgi:hypothetical protein
MKIYLVKTLFILSIASLSTLAHGEEKASCPLSKDTPKTPTVVIYPDNALSTGDEVQLDFVVPSASANGNETKRFLKVNDVDGSVSLLSLLYLAQNSDQAPANINDLILKALAKRKKFWVSDLNKQNHKPPLVPNSGVNPTLIQNSLDMTDFVFNRSSKDLDTKGREVLIKEVLGTMTDYDATFKYEYREFVDGKFVSKGPARLADLLPKEFYETASSTKGLGKIADKKTIGVSTCEYLPVLGRKPTAGVRSTIQSPNQGQR